jgi:hypothetical protein
MRVRGKYRTYCLDCNIELEIQSRIAEIFTELEELDY